MQTQVDPPQPHSLASVLKQPNVPVGPPSTVDPAHHRIQHAAHAGPQAQESSKIQAIADASPNHQALTQLYAMGQRKQHSAITKQASPQHNQTGLPDSLKSGLEHLGKMDLSDVKVHYNSARPAQLQAHAFAQGNQIHLGPGQERHLPHEGWHVVQQKQGRVKPTKQFVREVPINDDPGLEREADIMGAKAAGVGLGSNEHALPITPGIPKGQNPSGPHSPIQRVIKKAKSGKSYYSTLDSEQEQFKSQADAQAHEDMIKLHRSMGTKAGIHRSLKRKREKAGKTTFTGRWTSQIIARAPRDMAAERDAQLLKHISNAFFWFFRTQLSQKKEQEVECMFVNGRICVAANLEATLSKFHNHLEATEEPPSDTLAHILTTSHSPSDERADTMSQKMGATLEGARSFDSSEIEVVLRDAYLGSFFANKDCFAKYTTPSMLSDVAHQNKVIYIGGPGNLHAEQKLILALAKSGVKTPVIIRGKKRPCTSCYLMLKFAREELGFDINYNVHPGGYWSNANAGLHLLATSAGYTREKLGAWLQDAQEDPMFVHTNHTKRRKKHKTGKKVIQSDEKVAFGTVGDSGNATDSDSEAELNSTGDTVMSSGADSKSDYKMDLVPKSRMNGRVLGEVRYDMRSYPSSLFYTPSFQFDIQQVLDLGDCFYLCCLSHLNRPLNDENVQALRNQLANSNLLSPDDAASVRNMRTYATPEHIAAMAELLGVTFVQHENDITTNICTPIKVGNGDTMVHLFYSYDARSGRGHIQPLTPR